MARKYNYLVLPIADNYHPSKGSFALSKIIYDSITTSATERIFSYCYGAILCVAGICVVCSGQEQIRVDWSILLDIVGTKIYYSQSSATLYAVHLDPATGLLSI